MWYQAMWHQWVDFSDHFKGHKSKTEVCLLRGVPDWLCSFVKVCYQFIIASIICIITESKCELCKVQWTLFLICCRPVTLISFYINHKRPLPPIFGIFIAMMCNKQFTNQTIQTSWIISFELLCVTDRLSGMSVCNFLQSASTYMKVSLCKASVRKSYMVQDYISDARNYIINTQIPL